MSRMLSVAGCLVFLVSMSAATASTAASTAYFKVGDDLKASCEGTAAGEQDASTAEYLLCLGYLQAVVDTDATFAEWSEFARQACIPPGVTSSQLRQIFLDWLNERPDHLHYSAASLALTAFSEAWPCKLDEFEKDVRAQPAPTPEYSKTPSIEFDKPITASKSDVRRAQQILRDLGYDPGPVDGLIGARTRSAVISYQTHIGVQPTGEVSEALIAQLDSTIRIVESRKPDFVLPSDTRTAPKRAPYKLVSLPPVQEGAKSQPLNPSEVFNKTQKSVFVVLAAQSARVLRDGINVSQGSAVAISTKHLLTNCHILQNKPVIAVVEGDQILSAHLIIEERSADRCVLQVDGTGLIPIDGIRRYEDLVIGERVFTIGAPSGLEKSLGEGLVSGLREYQRQRLVQTSAPISPGSSGGGLFDQYGNLVGITTFLLEETQNLNFAIAAEEYWK